MAARVSSPDAMYQDERMTKVESSEERRSIKSEEAEVKGESHGENTPEVKEEFTGERNMPIELVERIMNANANVNVESAEEEELPNYLFAVQMILSDDPKITRFLSVPPSLTFADFHEVLQIAFGWTNRHTHTFTVDVFPKPIDGGRAQDQFAVLRLHTHPLSMDIPPEPQDEASWRLRDVFEKKEWEGEAGRPIAIGPGEGEVFLRYDYDMADGWRHYITLLGRAHLMLHEAVGRSGSPVLCFGGEGHPCAEDSGGRVGWQNLKDAFKKQRGNRNTKELKEWYKHECCNGDPEGLDPYRWDLLHVNDELRKLFEAEE